MVDFARHLEAGSGAGLTGSWHLGQQGWMLLDKLMDDLNDMMTAVTDKSAYFSS
jgi:hypothetical protein